VTCRVLFELPDGNWVAVFCSGTILDVATEMHELRLAACVAQNGGPIPTEPNPAAPACTTRGPLNDQDIRAAVQEYLLFAFVEGLEKTAAGGAASTEWLEIRRDR
jgi:hypothetical protein